MRAFFAPLAELADFQKIRDGLREGNGICQITGCVNSQKTHLIAALGQGVLYKILIFPDREKAEQVLEEFRFLEENLFFYPAKDLLFYHADIKGKFLEKQRMQVIRSLIESKGKDFPMTVITTIDALLDGLPSLEAIKERRIEIFPGKSVHFTNLQRTLSGLGYERRLEVDSRGQFAVRGGILDVFPLTAELPLRVELWGDEVDSVRSFDEETQRSLENLEKAVIYPAVELSQEAKNAVSFLDFFHPEDSILFLDEPRRLLERLTAACEEYAASQEKRRQAGEPLAEDLKVFSVKEITDRINRRPSVGLSILAGKCGALHVKDSFSVTVKTVGSYNNSFEMLTKDLKKLKKSGYRVILLSGSRTRAKHLAQDLRDYGLSSFYSELQDREALPGEILVSYGHVQSGYEYPALKFMVISETDIFGKRQKKSRRKVYEGRKIQNFSDLRPGDYVVHENHGVGIYQGIEKVEVDHTAKDYIKILYGGGSYLYIPATGLDVIQKYEGIGNRQPKLNVLGAPQWMRTKSQVEGAVRKIAKDLIKLYAARKDLKGYVYGPDTVWQKEFEEMFPFEETADQLQAIEDTKRDMESPKIMDRLVCGDVGYGKTEIALRAAFKAVQESRQVVYLVPTTILAQQHYNTFVQRMKDFPVRVELLCRFRTAAQQKKTIENLKKGLVDIVIGTHRVLSKDVTFKNLGLLIIDEEQRFGVTHKEKIKKLRKTVDVLTLTATPIPRTLHMSLIGIRDMSVLEEAPLDRVPIQTYVMEYNEEMVREAIERELSRNGQVYYVYNRVNDIAQVAARVQKLLPNAVVAYAHGQMNEKELENIMVDFINKDIDVLISTTIIETGIDIPNVNTMIIQDADRLGLAQLYQLRGRVGRSNRVAYAFLFYRKDKTLKESAEKRLAAIREFTDLGSGFKLAMRDLEIRGAGNLLGEEQHGHMEAVGYDLYCKMLNEAVKAEKGEGEEEDYATAMDLKVDAYIPDEYIPDTYQKLGIYKRIAGIRSDEEMEDMAEELTDRFGDLPGKVAQLLKIAALKALAHSASVTGVEQEDGTFKITMYEKAKVVPIRVPALIRAYRGALLFKNENPPYFCYMRQAKEEKGDDEILETVKNLINDIKGLLEP